MRRFGTAGQCPIGGGEEDKGIIGPRALEMATLAAAAPPVARLAATLDERARRGFLVTQSDRLGDTAVNTTSTTSRHNRVNRLFHDAKRAALDYAP